MPILWNWVAVQLIGGREIRTFGSATSNELGTEEDVRRYVRDVLLPEYRKKHGRHPMIGFSATRAR